MACEFSQATSNPTNVTIKGMSSTQSCDDPLYLVSDCSFHTVPGIPVVQTLVPVYTYKGDMQSLTGIIVTISQEVHVSQVIVLFIHFIVCIMAYRDTLNIVLFQLLRLHDIIIQV